VEVLSIQMVRAGKLHVVHVDRRAHSSTYGERYVKQSKCVGLHAPLLVPGLDCFEVGLELLGGCGWSLSVARTAVLSAKVAMVVVGEVGRSAVYMRYEDGPRTLPWGTPA
jgi:hypothetical protein